MTMLKLIEPCDEPVPAEAAAAQLVAAEHDLYALEAEQRGLPAAIKAAANAGDADEMRRLRHRQVDIDLDLWAARVRRVRAQIAHHEAQTAPLLATLTEYEQGELLQAQGRYGAALEAAQQAGEASARAQLEASFRRQSMEMNAEALRAARRELDALIVEAGREQPAA